MKVSIKLHEKETKENYYIEKKVVFEEVMECSEEEFQKIRFEYESKTGKYGMQNAGLDHCWYID